MESVARVVVRDRTPVLEPEVFQRPLNRVVLAVAVVGLVLQAVALVQVVRGLGQHFTWFDHLSFATVSLLWFALGVLVFLQRRERRTGQIFLLVSVAGSDFLSFGSLYSQNFRDALVFSTGLLLFAPLLLSFARAYRQERRWNPLELLIYIPPLALIWPGAAGLAAGPTTIAWRVAIALVGLYLIAAITQAFGDLYNARTPEEAAQSRALFFGLIAGTVPGTAIYVVPLVVTGSLSRATTWLPPIILLFLLAMSWAVLLFEFSEADLIVRRGVVYGVLTLGIVVVYGVLGFVLTATKASVINPGGGLAFVAVTIGVGAAFSPLRRSARRLVDWLLYGGQSDRWQTLQALSARLSIVMSPDELGERLVREIVQALHLRGAFLFRRQEGDTFEMVHRESRPPERADSVPDSPASLIRMPATRLEGALGVPPVALWLVHAKPLTAGRCASVPERYRELDDLRVALAIPLVTRSGLQAVLCLQSKLAHDAFDSDDLEILAPVIRQAGAALDTALLFEQLQEKVEELRLAYMRIAGEQEAERARLARELHDGTAQELAGLITLATVAGRQLVDTESAAHQTLDRLRLQAEDAYQGVRRASHALRPPMLDDFGLVPALEQYVRGYEETTGIQVAFDAQDVGPLEPEVELALFRVAQECMENVRKHSGADRASLTLHGENGTVALAVVDSGNGRDHRESAGIGLTGMRERVEAVGGEIHVSEARPNGFQVTAVVPVRRGIA